uniref:Putative DHS-like NAD/FAD-binding domain-containing protein n=1 Tax=Moniliophthora roreri TaxID=221103 RepID=A0A0W0F2I7_MONRR
MKIVPVPSALLLQQQMKLFPLKNFLAVGNVEP